MTPAACKEARSKEVDEEAAGHYSRRVAEEKPAKPAPPRERSPRPDFEPYLGPLGKKWYEGGCVKSGCLVFVILPLLVGLLLLFVLP